MATSTELRQLLRVLDERSVPIDPDDISEAFEDDETRHKLTRWMREYLTPTSLLTKEELAFSNARPELQSRRADDKIAVQSTTDEDFEAAIKALEASTVAIEKQSQVLEAQKQALVDFKSRQDGGAPSFDGQDSRQKKLAREKAQLDFDLNELAGSLSSRLQASGREADAAAGSLPPSVDRVLEKDDRLLDGLQKLLPKLAESDSDSDLAADVDRSCNAMALLSAREIRMRMDAVYRAHGASFERTINGETPKQAKKQIASVRAELDELSNEIDGLATMAVDGQYRLPITRELRSAGGDADSDRARWSEYLVATLQYLTTRLEALEEHFEHLHAHRGALRHVDAALASATTQLPKKKDVAHAALRSPATPIARGLKPLRLVEANLTEPQDPVLQLLRGFDIKVNDANDVGKLATTLQQATLEKQARKGDLSRSTDCNVSSQLAETMAKADRDVRDMLAAVYAHTEYGSVQLIDPQLKAALKEVEEKTSGLGDAMRVLDVDGLAREVKAKQRSALA